MRFAVALMATTAIAAPALADELNIYSYRQPELIQPILDGFTEQTGIDTNVAFVEKGLVEARKASRATVLDRIGRPHGKCSGRAILAKAQAEKVDKFAAGVVRG